MVNWPFLIKVEFVEEPGTAGGEDGPDCADWLLVRPHQEGDVAQLGQVRQETQVIEKASLILQQPTFYFCHCHVLYNPVKPAKFSRLPGTRRCRRTAVPPPR